MMRRHFALLGLAAAALIASTASLPVHAQTVDLAAVPDDSIALRWHRPDGAYDGWGVHFWESFEKLQDGKLGTQKERSDAPINGISWGAPMKPTGKDGFGAYWIVKAAEFRNGKINYIVHKGDTKDCTRDSTWLASQGRQVFINSGDCTAFFSLGEAVKNRK